MYFMTYTPWTEPRGCKLSITSKVFYHITKHAKIAGMLLDWYLFMISLFEVSPGINDHFVSDFAVNYFLLIVFVWCFDEGFKVWNYGF
jgi:hypothetical protein